MMRWKKGIAAVLAGIEKQRRVILTERDNFPTDIYIAEGLADLVNSLSQETGIAYEVKLIDDETSLRGSLDESVAVVALSHVNYRKEMTCRHLRHKTATAMDLASYIIGIVPDCLHAMSILFQTFQKGL